MLGVLFGLSVAWSQAVVVGQPQAPAATDRYDSLYNSKNVRHWLGTVVGKTKGQPSSRYSQGVGIVLRVPQEGDYQVDLGPSWYLSRQSLTVNVGDKIHVIGSRVRLSSDETVILAREVRRKGYVLTLREDDGSPYWAYRSSPKELPAVQSGQRRLTGTIRGLEEMLVEGETYRGVQLETPEGTFRVPLGPSWFFGAPGTPVIPPVGSVMSLDTIQRLNQTPYLFPNRVYTQYGMLTVQTPYGPVWNPYWQWGR